MSLAPSSWEEGQQDISKLRGEDDNLSGHALTFLCSWPQILYQTKKMAVEWQNNSHWKRPQEASSPTSYSNQGQLWGQVRLYRALLSLVLDICKRDCTSFFSTLFHCLTVLRVKKFFLISMAPYNVLCKEETFPDSGKGEGCILKVEQ